MCPRPGRAPTGRRRRRRCRAPRSSRMPRRAARTAAKARRLDVDRPRRPRCVLDVLHGMDGRIPRHARRVLLQDRPRLVGHLRVLDPGGGRPRPPAVQLGIGRLVDAGALVLALEVDGVDDAEARELLDQRLGPVARRVELEAQGSDRPDAIAAAARSTEGRRSASTRRRSRGEARGRPRRRATARPDEAQGRGLRSRRPSGGSRSRPPSPAPVEERESVEVLRERVERVASLQAAGRREADGRRRVRHVLADALLAGATQMHRRGNPVNSARPRTRGARARRTRPRAADPRQRRRAAQGNHRIAAWFSPTERSRGCSTRGGSRSSRTTRRCSQPSSVDVRVDRYFRVFHNARYPFIDVKEPQEDLTELVEIDEERPFILHPGEFVLGSTLERIRLPDDLVARLEGKSVARPARPADPLDRRLHRPRLGRPRHARALERRQPPDHDLLRDEDRPALVRAAHRAGGDAVRLRRDRLEVPGPAGPDAEPLLAELRARAAK